MHTNDTDVIFVKSGEGTMLVGGEMVDRRPDGTNEFKAPSLRGAQRFPLAAGAIFNIPPTVPHQIVVEPGHTVTYYDLKVREKPRSLE